MAGDTIVGMRSVEERTPGSTRLPTAPPGRSGRALSGGSGRPLRRGVTAATGRQQKGDDPARKT